MVQKLRWVMAVAVAWWLGALLMFHVKGYQTLPIFGVMMILFEVVPGIIFYRQLKSKQATSEAR